MDQVLEELAALLQRRQEVRAKIQSALVYPSILLALSAISLAVVIGVLIPSIAPVFAQGGKPLPAAIQLFLNVQARWVDILIGLSLTSALIIWAGSVALRRPAVRLRFDRSKLATPFAVVLMPSDHGPTLPLRM